MAPYVALRSGGTAWGELLRLERSLLDHYLQLAEAERGLAIHMRQLRRAAHGILQLERERQRLGRDLHTGVGQMLAAIRLQTELIAGLLPGAPEPAQQAIDRILGLARGALEQVRALSRRLHPPEWPRLTIEAALRQLWELSGIPERFEATLRIEPLLRQPGLESKTLIYRAAQEAFSNLTQHARATRVTLALDTRGERLVLTVADNGAGFDVAAFFAAPASVAAGIGLRSIREQAAGLGGRLDIESGPGGTKLEISAPFFPTGAPSDRTEENHAGTGDNDHRIS